MCSVAFGNKRLQITQQLFCHLSFKIRLSFQKDIYSWKLKRYFTWFYADIYTCFGLIWTPLVCRSLTLNLWRLPSKDDWPEATKPTHETCHKFKSYRRYTDEATIRPKHVYLSAKHHVKKTTLFTTGFAAKGLLILMASISVATPSAMFRHIFLEIIEILETQHVEMVLIYFK